MPDVAGSTQIRTSLPAAVVVRVLAVDPHPNADRLDILRFVIPVDFAVHGHHEAQVVTGKHYKAHTEGVWFTPGSLLPGYLAEDMWLQKGARYFEVREFPIRGELSSGIFGGSVWRETPDHPYQPWRLYKSSWRVGDDVSAYFGVTCPPSSVAEQRLVKPEVAVASDVALGSTPAAGSPS